MKPVFVVTIGLLGCASIACVEPSRDCKKACGLAGACGILPSALGADTSDSTALDNCTERCNRTDPELRDRIQKCLDEPSPQNVINGWCLHSRPCSVAAACLKAAFPDEPDILGRASVEVTAVTAGQDWCADTPLSACEVLPVCSTADCHTPSTIANERGCDRRICATPPERACDELGSAYAVVGLVGSTGEPASLPHEGPCPMILGRSRTLQADRPGWLRAFVRLTLNTQTPTPSCREFFGPWMVAQAGTVERAYVSIPSMQQLSIAVAMEGERICAPVCRTGDAGLSH